MIPLGLNAAGHADLQTALHTPGRVRTSVVTLNLAGEHVGDLTRFVADGQVDGSGVERQLTMTLDDPHRRLPFDSDDPADTALFLDRMIRASYEVLVNGDWVSVPVFTGPVTGLARNGAEVTVTASDKATLYKGAAWRPITLHKGMKRTDALARLATESNPVYSEPSRFLFLPDLSGRLPHHIALKTDSVPWDHMQQLAHASDRQLFYNGRGELHARVITSHRSVFTFRGDQHVTGPVQINYSPGTVNACRVVGAVPKGHKLPVTGMYVAPANHPLSPQRTGRYLLPSGGVVRDSKIKTGDEAAARAKRLVEDGLREGVDVSFESVPVPFLDLGDIVHVHTSDASVTFRVRSFSLPLVVGDSAVMSVGTHMNVQHRVRHHRHHKRPRPPRKHRHPKG